MRILQLGKFYAPDKGGMETALRHLVEGLLSAGHDVRVLVAGHGRRTRRDDLPGAAQGLIRAGALGSWNSQPLTLTLLRLLRRELRDFRPDIVHLHLPNPLACLAWRLARHDPGAAAARWAIWHHADIVRQRIGRFLVGPLTRRCLKDADGICVSSETWRQTSRQLAPWRARVQVIPFGIDPQPFLAAAPQGDGPFLFIGRLVAYKGLWQLLAAVARLPEARLEIAGVGPLMRSLARRCAAPDLRGRVRLLGNVADEDLPALMARCRALVLPSLDRSETFGLVLLEAMAAGLPLITSDLPTGVRELNRPGQTGWLVEPGDVDGLRQTLAEVLADPARSRALGRNGRRLVTASYGRTRMVAAVIAWYDELLAATGSGTRVVNDG